MSDLKYKEAGVFISVAGEGGAAPYARPADWLALPAVNVGDQKFVGLHAVYDHESNFVAVQCRHAYTVDWGDGVVENVNFNAIAYHNYSFANLGPETLSSRGYRQAIVTITPQAGQNLTQVDLSIKHNQAGLVSGYTTGWLDIRMVGSSVITLSIANSTVPFRMLEQFEYVGTSAITTCVNKFQNCAQLRSVIGTDWTASSTTFNSMFIGCSSLQTVPLLNTTIGTAFDHMFSGCSSLHAIPLFDTDAGTTFYNMFANCSSLQSVPLLDTGASTNFANMFMNCLSLQTIPLLNTATGTDFSSMFSGCSSLQSVPLLNTGAGTLFNLMFNGCSLLKSVPLLNTAGGTNFATMFNGCLSLQAVPILNTSAGTSLTGMFQNCPSLRVGALAGTSKTISYLNCALGPAALDDIYTNLAAGVTAQTITVTGNWGTASDTPSIATAKGWTVTG